MTHSSDMAAPGAFSRRRLLGASGALGIAAVLATPARAMAQGTAAGATRVPNALGVLGADYDQNLTDIHDTELRAARSRWLRGFFPMPQADTVDPADNPFIQSIVAAGKRGYGTVFSLKFPYNKAVMPAPGTEAMALALERLDKVLPAVMGKVDILVIGNEPFIESRPEDRDDALNVFYETIAARVIAYWRAHGGGQSKTLLYMGALNRLDLAANQTAGTERWMQYVRETPEIQGVDIHPHVPSPEAVPPFLDYILPRMRADQTFLVTEFSLVWLWKAHLSDQIPAEYASRYGYAPGTLVWQVVAAAIDNPIPQAQWNDFLAASPWFQAQRNFLTNQVTAFRQTGRLAVATYGIRQGVPMVTDFGPNKVPWVFNAVYDNHMVQPASSGLPGRNMTWFDEFRALQHGYAGLRR